MRKDIIPPRLRSQATALTHDTLMVPIAWALAFWLRFNLGTIPFDFYQSGLRALLVLMPVQLAAFTAFGLYRGVWRFASLPDIIRILKAVLIGTATVMALLFIFTRAEGIPRSVPIIYSIVSCFVTQRLASRIPLVEGSTPVSVTAAAGAYCRIGEGRGDVGAGYPAQPA